MQPRQPQIGYTLVDASDTQGITRFNIRAGVEVAPAQAAAAQLRTRLGPLTGCRFLRQSIVYPFVDVYAPMPLSGFLAERMGVFVFATSEPGRYGIIEIPGIPESTLMTSGPGAFVQIDPAAPAVAALVAELVSGRWCNPFGQVLTALEAAFLQIRP